MIKLIMYLLRIPFNLVYTPVLIVIFYVDWVKDPDGNYINHGKETLKRIWGWPKSKKVKK